MPTKPFIHAETLETLAERLRERGEKPFRAKQIMGWLYGKRVESASEMSNLPAKLRDWLGETFDFAPTQFLLDKSSSDTTDKLLLRLGDESLIETVLIRGRRGEEASDATNYAMDRRTVCVSTQVGCAYGCKFCASGLAGWRRDLHAGEIMAQFLEICRREDPGDPKAAQEGRASFDNVVIMGMGEPLANYEALVRALTILNAPWGLNFGARRITVSTSGVVPKIYQLADEPIQFRLAISLHGATNEVRERIMPVNRKWPLEELLPAAQAFSEKHGRMITLEYILIEDVNDMLDQASQLARIAERLHAHVNLIPYNRVEGLDWKRPNLKRQQAFAKILRDAKVSATLRKEKGHDIEAACGQLRLQEERERGTSAKLPVRK